MSFHYMFKFVIIGDSGILTLDSAVGKSSINQQFTEKQTILNHNATIGVQFGAKILKLENKSIKIQIWDTAGQENFRSIARSYYQNAIGALLVYDITRRETFNGVRRWYEQLKENGNQNIEILLVGNKSDLESKRVVSREEGERFARENGIRFVEISARSYQKVCEAFQGVALNVMERMEKGEISMDDKGVKLGDSPKKASTMTSKLGKSVIGEAGVERNSRRGCC